VTEKMPQNTHLAAITAEMERLPEPSHAAQDPQVLHQKASALAASLPWLPSVPSSRTFVERGRALARALKPMLRCWKRLCRNCRFPTISGGFTKIVRFSIRNSRIRLRR